MTGKKGEMQRWRIRFKNGGISRKTSKLVENGGKGGSEKNGGLS